MNILLWILQVLLALHTGVGAVWKFSHPPQNVPSLLAIPHGLWMALSLLELLCVLGLILPAFKKSWSILAPVAAISIAAEMLFFCGVHLHSGAADYGPVIYWLVVTAFCAFIAYGRLRSTRNP